MPRAPRSRTALASSELGSRLSDALEGSFDGAVLAGGEQALETVEGVAERAERLAEGLAILLEDFPPDDGSGGRDACGVVEATRRHLKEGVIVRPMSSFGMETTLRVTIGTPEENRRLVKALKKVLGEVKAG